jgi:hypothetical protein
MPRKCSEYSDDGGFFYLLRGRMIDLKDVDLLSFELIKTIGSDIIASS